MRTPLLFATLFLISPTFASGHEFWIEPSDYYVEPDQDVVAQLKVGEGFEGANMAFLPVNFARFELVAGDRISAVTSRIGDRPALSQPLEDDGLWVIVNETGDARLVYQEWDLFVDFVKHKDLAGTLENHAERGLPQTGFAELYRRYAKSLVATGSAAGNDQELGLRTEIVAGANPYLPDFDGTMPVQVLFEGAPRVDAQVELFDRAPDGSVTVTTWRTDDEGRVSLPVEPGHEYLVDAVKMLPLDGQGPMQAVWYSLWASLTFSVPAAR